MSIFTRCITCVALVVAYASSAFGWRGYEMYGGGTFGLQLGDSYDVVSWAPDAIVNTTTAIATSSASNSNTANSMSFGTGLTFGGYVGYSAGNSLVFEGEISFGSSDATSNYFAPDGFVVSSSTIADAVTNSGNSASNTRSKDRLSILLGMVNALIFLDTGADLAPYIGGGFGMMGATWGGFKSGAVGYQLIAGIDLLLIPKMALMVQLSSISCGDIQFDTVHYVALMDTTGNPVLDSSLQPLYRAVNSSDTLKSVDFIRLDFGLRIAF